MAAPLALAAVVGTGVVAAPASADTPWIPYREGELLIPAARSTCGFDVRITPLEDDEEYRTTSTWPDGSPRTLEFRGTLVERYTNESTGASVERDLSATAVFALREDGSPESLTSVHGAFGATMPPGSTPDTGLYVLGGHGTSVTFNPDGTHTFELGPHGTAEDVCDALA
ncbi:MAG TPA: hypothetical protein VFN34_08320 [Ornithinibacter sp.]|nr:hypothetical protein [Ornithinibacter sp.]